MYTIRDDFLPVREGLRDAPPAVRREIKKALRALRTDPRSERLGCTRVTGNTYKIVVSAADEEWSVLYKVDDENKEIDLVRLKSVSAIRKTLRWLGGLLDYKP